MAKISFFLFFFLVFNLISQSQEENNLLKGFGEVTWETSYQEVLDRFSKLIQAGEQEEEIQIIKEVEEKMLLIKRNGILYIYRFYQAPQALASLDPENATAEVNTETKEITYKSIGYLYAVSSVFNYISTQDLQQILEEKYGNPQKIVLNKDNQSNGAVLWDLSSRQEEPQGGIIMLWFDNYHNSKFSRKIDYVSMKLKQKIEKDYIEYYKVKETELLKKFIP